MIFLLHLYMAFVVGLYLAAGLKAAIWGSWAFSTTMVASSIVLGGLRAKLANDAVAKVLRDKDK